MQVAELLDRAKSHTGSDRATADAMGVKFQKISDWRHEREPCAIEQQVRLCGIAGLDEQEAMRYVWGVLRERLGKYRSAVPYGGAALIAFMGAGVAQLAAAIGERCATMYRPYRAQSSECQLGFSPAT